MHNELAYSLSRAVMSQGQAALTAMPLLRVISRTTNHPRCSITCRLFTKRLAHIAAVKTAMKVSLVQGFTGLKHASAEGPYTLGPSHTLGVQLHASVVSAPSPAEPCRGEGRLRPAQRAQHKGAPRPTTQGASSHPTSAQPTPPAC